MNIPSSTTVVIVQQPTRYWGIAPRVYQGARMGGFVTAVPLLICMGVFGSFFILSGSMAVIFGSHEQKFWSKFNYKISPITVAGFVLIGIGGSLIIACVACGCYAKHKYKQLVNTLNENNPGRIINQNPGTSLDFPVPLDTMGYSGTSGIGFGQNPGGRPTRYNFVGGGMKGPPQEDNPPSYLDSTLQVPYQGTGLPDETISPNAPEYELPPPYSPNYKPPEYY